MSQTTTVQTATSTTLRPHAEVIKELTQEIDLLTDDLNVAKEGLHMLAHSNAHYRAQATNAGLVEAPPLPPKTGRGLELQKYIKSLAEKDPVAQDWLKKNGQFLAN